MPFSLKVQSSVSDRERIALIFLEIKLVITYMSRFQLEAAFERYVTLVLNDDASTMDDIGLTSLGEFACGASASHINSFNTDVYR